MTLDDIRAALIGRLADSWTQTPVAYPNREYTPTTGQAWIWPTVRPGDAIEGEKGQDGLGLRFGIFYVDIYTPLGIGSRPANDLAANIEALYRRADVGGVMCGEPSTWEYGNDGHGWWHVQTRVPIQAWTGE